MIHLLVKAFQDPKAGSRALLREGLRICSLPDIPLAHDDNGRPYLPGGPELSISHTKNAAAVALSDKPVGVDVETLRPIRPEVPRRVMSNREFQWFVSRGGRLEDFFALWTLKESWFKYLGTGLPGFPNGTEFSCMDGMWRLAGQDQVFRVWKKDLLTVALCGDEQEVQIRFL